MAKERSSLSLRYSARSLRDGFSERGPSKSASRPFDLRSSLLRVFGVIQRKKVVILRDNPRLCGAVLAASDTKGAMIERLLAQPAWRPSYSIESEDGARWKQLATDAKTVMARLHWRERLPPIIARRFRDIESKQQVRAGRLVDAELFAKLVGSIMFELVFDFPMSTEDEALFYSASLEWRKQIAVKAEGDGRIKQAFWSRLTVLVEASEFKDGLTTYASDPAAWLSVFAQPFLISPMINVGDIFAAAFEFLRKDAQQLERAKGWARDGDRPRIEGVLLEAIRLRHPFPILERELSRDLDAEGHKIAAGTHVFMTLDDFDQDQTFDPERWLAPAKENPYHAIPFAAGPRMCIGKPIALELMAQLMTGFLLSESLDSFQPSVGHLFSGRDNDGKESIAESVYQVRVFAKAMWRSMRIRS